MSVKTMWHEARRQERKIRGLMVDYRKRAQRRREYYEKIKQDPAQFLQVHGRRVKIHLDPAVANLAEAPGSMMPWLGDSSVVIDRFDARSHLDAIPEFRAQQKNVVKSQEETNEDSQINYERYRILVQNEFLGVNEEKFLQTIYMEEQYGTLQKNTIEEEKKKQLADKRVAIGYVYEDSTVAPPTDGNRSSDNESEEPDSDDDFDLTVDVNALNNAQMHELNKKSERFGLGSRRMVEFLFKDVEEAEALRMAKLEEEAQQANRKSRRERRANRGLERRIFPRNLSPPSYAARGSPTYDPYKKRLENLKSQSRSRSRSGSPPQVVTYITSFGGEDSDEGKPVMGPALPAKQTYRSVVEKCDQLTEEGWG